MTTRRQPIVDTIFGRAIADPYRWLESGEDPEVVAWQGAQNSATEAWLSASAHRAQWQHRLTELLSVPVATSPSWHGDWLFTLERGDDREQFVLVARSAHDETIPPRVLFDPAASTGETTSAIDWFHPSPLGDFVAFGISESGSERSMLHIVDVMSGGVLGDEIRDTRAASVAWLSDATGFAYARYPAGDEYGRHIRWHTVGTDESNDPVIWDRAPLDDPDPRSAWPDVSMSDDDRYLLIHVALGWSRVDVHLIERSTGRIRTVIESVSASTRVQFATEPDGCDTFLIGITTIGAGRGRVFRAELEEPAKWTTIVAEQSSVTESLAVSRDRIYIGRSEAAVGSLAAYRFDGSEGTTIDLPAIGSLAGIATNSNQRDAFVAFESFTQPSTIYRVRHDTAAGAYNLAPWIRRDPLAFDAGDFVTESVTYPSLDGTSIPMFLVRHRDTIASATTPTILTGYGGFNISMTPAYGAGLIALAEAGGQFAVACLRGGAEFGDEWHEAGMRANKQNVFDDFAAAADWLVDTNHTSREHLALRGGSNGGLLVSVAATQRPDLANAIHCAVPLCDMIRYPLFLIARLWMPEYGDPEEPEQFDWLAAYSPYHHTIPDTPYPAMLITTADHDSRVDPCHARKMAAALQHATSRATSHPILLRVESQAGHGQGKPVHKQAAELADVFTFLMHHIAR